MFINEDEELSCPQCGLSWNKSEEFYMCNDCGMCIHSDDIYKENNLLKCRMCGGIINELFKCECGNFYDEFGKNIKIGEQ